MSWFEHWTLFGDVQALVAGEWGSTRFGSALLQKFYVRLVGSLVDAVSCRTRRWRSSRSRSAFRPVSWLLPVVGQHDCSHHSQVRACLGFRECSVQDADTLAGWLAVHVCDTDRRPDQVREELRMRCRAERIEPPATKRVGSEGRRCMFTAERTPLPHDAATGEHRMKIMLRQVQLGPRQRRTTTRTRHDSDPRPGSAFKHAYRRASPEPGSSCGIASFEWCRG
jgi:hypothetical protein